MYLSRLSGTEYPSLKSYTDAAIHNAKIISSLLGGLTLEAHRKHFGRSVISSDPLYAYLHQQMDGLNPNVIDNISYQLLKETRIADLESEDYVELIDSRYFNTESFAEGVVEIAEFEDADVLVSPAQYPFVFINLYGNIINQIWAYTKSKATNIWINDIEGKSEIYGHLDYESSTYYLSEMDEDELLWNIEQDPPSDRPRRIARGMTIEQRNRRILRLSKALRLNGIKYLKLSLMDFSPGQNPEKDVPNDWIRTVLIDNNEKGSVKRTSLKYIDI